jgi:hypothetical protein
MNIQELNYDARDENSLCISVSGIDAAKFLQGQFSNDIDILTEKSYQNSSFSTNQGKVIAIFKIIKEEDSFIIVINKEISDYFIKKLSMYVLMSKVNIEVMKDIHVYGVIGEVANTFINENNLNLYSVMKNNDVWVLNNSEDEIKGLTVLSKLAGSTLQKTSNFNANHFLDMKKGMLRITMESKEKYIPQVLNLESLNGISYKKGCYTGQEIVARTHYLGKIKKKLVLLNCSSINLKIEDKIFDEGKQVVGEILTSAFEDNDSYLYLAVIRLDNFDGPLVANNHKLSLIPF